MFVFNKTSIIEGFYIETVDNLFFTVKGIHHPDDEIISYLRYIPNTDGLRKKDGIRYTRLYDINNTTQLLRKKYPQYLRFIESKAMELQAVPVDRIKKIYNPRDKLNEILKKPETPRDLLISKFVEILTSEGNVNEYNLGISGSILIGLDNESSDVDLIVYGMKSGYKIYESLKKARCNLGWISGYNQINALRITEARWGNLDIDVETLKNIEKRKLLHGMVDNRDYFIRLVRYPGEWKKELKSTKLFDIVLEGKVINAEERLFTPCSYKIDESKKIPDTQNVISELVSYRGKFTEQAEEGDKIRAKGSMEQVIYNNKTVYRVMLGRKNDYLIPIKE